MWQDERQELDRQEWEHAQDDTMELDELDQPEYNAEGTRILKRGGGGK